MTVLFAGSFDPPSFGHLDIIRRAMTLADHLIVGVTAKLNKQPLFSAEEKVRLLKKLVPNVEIVSFQHLAVDLAREKNATHLIRGLRTTSDLHHEFQMALANRRLSNLETIFILGNEKYSHISSTLIKEIAYAGGSLKEFVPAEVEKAVKAKLGPERGNPARE